MKRVLVLAYYFPPLGGAGVQRTVKLLKHLPGLGYEPVVVTSPEDADVSWAPADLDQAHDVPPGTEIQRVRPPANRLDPASRSRLERLLARPGAFARWWVEAAVETATPLARGADVLYVSMSPFESAEAATRIAAATGIPWVADLRDPWALDEWSMFPSVLHRLVEERRMGRLLESAAVVIMNTEEARLAAAERFPALADRLVVVTNGFDAEDLTVPPEPREEGRIRVVYAGYSHVADGRRHRRKRRRRELLGASVRGLDLLPRSHVFLVEAVRRAIAEDPSLAGRIEVQLAGASPPAGTDPFVVDRGYLSHRDAVALMRSADVLFLPMHGVPADRRVRTVPGKTYEYLATGRPILAALPPGDARDLLEGRSNVRLAGPSDVPGIAQGLLELIAAALPPSVHADVASRFERRVIAERIVAVLDRAAGQR